MSKDINLKTLPADLANSFHKLGRYAVITFIVFLAVIYSFLLFRINTLTAAEPSDEAIAQTQTPRIDQKIVDQLLELKDNNVTVQALFEDARSNPFQE
jgi:hypothetical protein